nr:MAG TPA: hypothetical protein [Bacteriophage sp.]
MLEVGKILIYMPMILFLSYYPLLQIMLKSLSYLRSMQVQTLPNVICT